MNYNIQDMIYKASSINDIRRSFIQELGRIGIYLPKTTSLRDALFCVYFYYMYNLFNNNNTEWKDKYFPLDGATLRTFVEENLQNRHVQQTIYDSTLQKSVQKDMGDINKRYRDIADEIVSVIYPRVDGQFDNETLDRGKIKKFIDLYEYMESGQNTLDPSYNKYIGKEKFNVLPSTNQFCTSIIDILLWKNTVIEGMSRKKNEQRQPVVNLETSLNQVLNELRTEPSYNLPDLEFDRNILVSSKDLINIAYNNYGNNDIQNPYTIYARMGTSYSYYGNRDKQAFIETSRFLFPSLWEYNPDPISINNYRSNTVVATYDSTTYRYYSPSGNYGYKNPTHSFNVPEWSNLKDPKSIQVGNITVSETRLLRYYDKYDGIYQNKEYSLNLKSYLGFKPKVMLYSKQMTTKSSPNISSPDSPLDNMNSFKIKQTGNLGMSILLPDLVDYNMRFPKQRYDYSNIKYNNYGSTPGQDDNLRSQIENIFNRIYDVDESLESTDKFLIGIYPVDKDNRIMYEDPIAFEYLVKQNLSKDLGLGFANYVSVNRSDTYNKPFEHEFFPLKLGQVFYRNKYSQYQKPRPYKVIQGNTNDPEPSITFGDDDSIGNESKNLLYLYGKDVYMNKIGKTSIPSGHNFSITNPDDNTNITTIDLPNTTEYTFKKYGTTKIAVQLYLIRRTDFNFKGFPKNEPNSPSEENRAISGTFLGLPYGVRTNSNDNSIVKYVVNSDKPYPRNIAMPTPLDDNECQRYNNGDRDYQLNFCTEPVIIDSDNATTDNAPWLDETNAPYVYRVVTQDEGVDIYINDTANYVHWDPGIYIKLPDILDRLLMGEEVPKYDIALLNKTNFDRPAGFSNETPYGGMSYSKNIIALANALVGVRINYNPIVRNDSESDITNKYKDSTNTKILTNSDDFCVKDMRYVDENREVNDNNIKSKKNEYYLWIRKSVIDYEGAGLGRCKDIKIQLIFRNDFFRSSDPDSPLNYDYVPIKGHVKLLREIAGQRIKLYRGGRLVHPTDYTKKGDRQNISSGRILDRANLYFENIKEVILNREVNDGHYSDCFINTERYTKDNLVDSYGVNNSNVFNVKDSVFDIISIEMDRPHWQQLLTDYNTNAINSLETDTSNNSILFPINLEDNEDLNLFTFDIEENSSILDGFVTNVNDYRSTSTENSYLNKFKPKIDLSGESLKKNDTYKYLLFWYFFRPKVKFVPSTTGSKEDLVMQIESLQDWKERITRENRAYFNRKKVKFESVNLGDMTYLHPYNGWYESQDNVVELKDVFNVSFNLNTSRTLYNSSSIMSEVGVNRENGSALYMYFVNTILSENRTSSYNSSNNELYISGGGTWKQSRFGGWLLERMLNHEWVFSFNNNCNREFDEKLRVAANDIALYIFKLYNATVFSLCKEFVRQKNYHSYDYSNHIGFSISGTDYVSGISNKISFSMSIFYKSYYYSYNELNIGYNNPTKYHTSKERLVRFLQFISSGVLGDGTRNYHLYYAVYKDGKNFKDDYYNRTQALPYNITDTKYYKGDNKLQITKDKRFIKRGFRMGKRTPDNPFMGFSIPATMDPNTAPDYVHIVYCDIKWSDFDKTVNRINTDNWNSVAKAEITRELDLPNQYHCNIINSKYDFTGFEDKFHFEEWANQDKHIIIRLFTDIPTNEAHRDCPPDVTGTEYENSLGKGFKPNMENIFNKIQYILAFIALSRWLRDKYGNSRVIDYIWAFEIGFGHNNYGYNIINDKKIYDRVLKDIYFYLNVNIPDMPTTFGNTNGYRKFNILTSYNIKLPSKSDNKFNKLPMVHNLGNKEDVDMWVKYNYVGSTRENSYQTFIENFDLRKSFKAGVIRNDISMEELMKPDNYRDLLYSFKSINPMFVIGYIDKEKYPEQYEELMNEMGYKLTVTSVEMEPGKVTLNYSNEGHNNIYSIPNINVNLNISVKGINNSGIDTNIADFDFLQTYDVQRNTEKLAMTTNISKLISQNFNTKGDVKLFDTTYKTGTFTIQNVTYTNPKLSSICGKSKPVNMFASFQISLVNRAVDGPSLDINLANVNRKTEINLTDSSFLKNFIINNEDANWYSENIENNYKMDENGWI